MHLDDKDIKISDIFICRNGDPDIIVSIYDVFDSYGLLNYKYHIAGEQFLLKM